MSLRAVRRGNLLFDLLYHYTLPSVRNHTHMDNRIINHFKKVDPILAAVIDKVEIEMRVLPTNYFLTLCDAIISQQLSEKAGATIYGRFEALFGGGEITPEKILKVHEDTYRSVGMSYAKARFVRSLAQSVLNRDIDLDSLPALSNEEVIATLTKLKGIGPWTAEMFLMFTLGREDVFSYGDLGLKRAIQKLYAFAGVPTPAQIEKIEKKWSPYRTYACRILWKSLSIS